MSTWYCITTAPRREHRARDTLSRAGIGVYLPQRRIERQHRRTKVWTEFRLPLMPGYLFADLPANPDWMTIRACDGVSGALGVYDDDGEARPFPIRSTLVEGLMAAQLAMEFDETRRARAVRRFDPWPLGSKVRIVDGPFAMFPGEVASHTEDRIEVLVAILGGLVPVHLDIGQIEMAA